MGDAGWIVPPDPMREEEFPSVLKGWRLHSALNKEYEDGYRRGARDGLPFILGAFFLGILLGICL